MPRRFEEPQRPALTSRHIYVYTFLLRHLRLRDVPTLKWDDPNRTFLIRWTHQRSKKHSPEDKALFVLYETEKRGKSVEDYSEDGLKVIKARFRNALNRCQKIKFIDKKMYADGCYRKYEFCNKLKKETRASSESMNHNGTAIDLSTKSESSLLSSPPVPSLSRGNDSENMEDPIGVSPHRVEATMADTELHSTGTAIDLSTKSESSLLSSLPVPSLSGGNDSENMEDPIGVSPHRVEATMADTELHSTDFPGLMEIEESCDISQLVRSIQLNDELSRNI